MPSEQQLSEGLSLREFARSNKISIYTVRRNVALGKIPAYKVGGLWRIRVDDAAAIQRTGPDHHDVDAEIKRIVDLAPKLTPAQRDTIAALFASVQDGGGVNGAA